MCLALAIAFVPLILLLVAFPTIRPMILGCYNPGIILGIGLGIWWLKFSHELPEPSECSLAWLKVLGLVTAVAIAIAYAVPE